MSEADLIETFLNNCPDAKRQIVYRIVAAIHRVDPELQMAIIKWKQLTFAKDGDFHHWICAIRLTKNSVNLYYHFGGLLDDPEKMLQSGSSKFLRVLPFSEEAEVDDRVIEHFSTLAIEKLPYFIAHWKEVQVGVI